MKRKYNLKKMFKQFLKSFKLIILNKGFKIMNEFNDNWLIY